MATVDPKRRALVKALMERDLYEMLGIPRDAGDEEILAAVTRRTEWVEETPMRHADRETEMHWLAWAERALVADPGIRAEYDAALNRQAAAAARAVEATDRVRRLRIARDQLARREASRSVPIETAAKKAPAPRRTARSAAPAGAGPEVADALVEVAEALEVTTEAGGTVFADITETVVVEVVDTPAGEVEVAEVIEAVDTIIVTDDGDGASVTEVIEAVDTIIVTDHDVLDTTGSGESGPA